jgi:acetylornithine/N-succinyldiaminopimelate aminotransferase
MNQRPLFLKHIAQTSPAPLGLEIVRANGIHLFDTEGKAYVDLISGFSVMNLGHGNAAVKAAIHQQVEDYMHLMVYGELIEHPQVAYAHLLTRHLPATLNCVYFTNSGTEATEGATKLAKRATGRTEMLAFNRAYHGSTQGALSLMGSEYWRNAYRPLLPGVKHLDFNTAAAIDAITHQTACVVVEVVQAEAGVYAALTAWLHQLRQKCTDTGALLIFDEIQTGFGRTGTLWAFEACDVVPDVLLLGKALGGGLPLGAFVASHQLMQLLTHGPVLGHISTFGGHPVCCAAGMAAFQQLLQLQNDSAMSSPTYWAPVLEKEQQFRSLLQHPAIVNIRSRGLLMAVEFADAATCQRVCHACLQAGLVTDWFLFAPHCLRIAPPLIINHQQIAQVCATLLGCIKLVCAYGK